MIVGTHVFSKYNCQYFIHTLCYYNTFTHQKYATATHRLLFDFAEDQRNQKIYMDAAELNHIEHEVCDPIRFTPGKCPYLPADEWDPHLEEMRTIMRSLPNKAPGPDGTSMAQMKLLEKEVLNFIRLCWSSRELPEDIGKAFLASIPKPNSTDERNISIVQCIEQVFMKLLLWRNAYCPLNDAQYGFRKAKSGPQAIYLTRHLIHNKKRACFIDLKKAFDTVNREALFALLPSYGFGNTAIALIRRLYDNDVAHLKVDGKLAGDIKPTVGVKQGSVLSPLLFIIFMDHVFAQLSFNNAAEITLLAYAEDIVIFGDSELQLQQRLNEFHSIVSNMGMTISETKTKVLDPLTAHGWSLHGQASQYMTRRIPMRAGANTALSHNDTRLYVPPRQMQGRKAIRIKLNCPFIDCLYSASNTRVRSPQNLIKNHLRVVHGITISKFEPHIFVPVSVRTMNRAVTAASRQLEEEQDTKRFHVGAVSINEVNTFKYLGSLVAASDSLMPDLKRRRSLTLTAIRMLHNVTKRLDRATVVRTMETFVLPILMFGSETYQIMNNREQDFFNASYMTVWRRATKMDVRILPDGSVTHHANARVLAVANQRTPEAALVARREAFMCTMRLDPLLSRMPAWN